ncbi:hypothetical protein LYSHEL_08640 [Lysobacter helvus]|uniref:Uncharacterized protein n=2 Tax=Lysobacteraceae TaxID=32033 RepID=A0ABN6FRA2_9GAMM|nr:hypothetical protein LYSCAS_08640 [Lysobacter caseinilyticus]BCT94993.1 hypothetical protein LYSHEL_08640 [Lysobacter helvus]
MSWIGVALGYATSVPRSGSEAMPRAWAAGSCPRAIDPIDAAGGVAARACEAGGDVDWFEQAPAARIAAASRMWRMQGPVEKMIGGVPPTRDYPRRTLDRPGGQSRIGVTFRPLGPVLPASLHRTA